MQISYRFIYQFIVVTLLSLVVTTALAQNEDAINTFTPYSFYGLGDLSKPGTAYNFGMGGIGAGVRTSRQINFVNPAALSVQDSLSFMIDFGMESLNYYSTYNSSFDDKQHKAASNSTNIHHVVLSFPLFRRVVIGVGLFPYSNVGYNIQSTELRPDIIANTGNIYYNYVGEGGISQIALSMGARIGKHLSLGAQGQYYFGTIDRYTIVRFTTNSSFSDLVAGASLKAGNFGGSLGAQYEFPLKNNMFLTLGATYQFSTKIGKRLVDFALSETAGTIDTVRLNETTQDGMAVPQTISFGLSVGKHNVWMAGLDYVYQDWRGTSYSQQSQKDFHFFQVTPSHLLRAGVEWTPRRYDFRSYLSRCTYRMGLTYERTYMSFDDYQIKDVSASIGLSLPINRWNNNITMSAEVGRRGTLDNGLIKEMYLKFNVSFSLYDIWFVKPKID